MKRIRSVSVSLTLMACLGMVIPQAALAEVAVAKRQAVKTLDVTLHDGGLFVGQVVTSEGKVKSGVEVSILQTGQELARTKTDKMGRFAVTGMTGGAYQVATTSGQIPVRTWTKEAAPPKTAFGALLVEGITVRGQCNCHSGESAGYIAGGEQVEDPATSYGSSYNGASFNRGGTNYDAGATYYDEASANYGDGSSGFYDASGGAAACQGGGCGHGCGCGGGLLGVGLLGGGGGLLGGAGGVLTSGPTLIGLGVAAAIAIPVALDDDDAS